MHTITARSRLAALRRARPLARLAAPAEPVIDRIRSSLIGDDAVLDGPFGPRRIVLPGEALAR
jgi:hypothetical protein